MMNMVVASLFNLKTNRVSREGVGNNHKSSIQRGLGDNFGFLDKI